MTVPTAVATGKDAHTPTAVSPVRAGIVAGLLAALVVAASLFEADVPERMLALFGGPTGLERTGGMRMEWQGPDGEVRRFEMRDVLPEDVPIVAQRMAGTGLAFHVVRQLDEGEDLFRRVEGQPARYPGITPEIDQWMPEGSTTRHTDYYLLASSRADLDAAFATARGDGWNLPAGVRIAYEPFDAGPGEPRWRSYVIDERPSLDGRHIANAVASYDPNTNRPIILLDFDEEGAAIFGELTAQIIGMKLATVVAGEVRSAPIINGAIRGGRASITMGGSDVLQQEQERDVLVATLRTGPLPPGGEVTSAVYVEPVDPGASESLAHGALALLAGLLVGLVGWATVRQTRPTRVRPVARAVGAVPWARIAVTLLAPVTVVLLTYVPALGIDRSGLDDVTLGDNRIEIALGLLGLTPIIGGYLVTELLALAIPAWRRRRHAGMTARLPLGYAVVAMTVLLALLQGWHQASYYARVDLVTSLPLFLASLLGGTLVLAIVAEVIRRRGLGNGYGALIASGFLVATVRGMLIQDPFTRETIIRDAWQLIVITTAIVAVAIVTMATLRWRVARVGELALRIPTAGAGVVLGARALLVVIALALAGLQMDDGWARVTEWTLALDRPSIALVAALLLGVLGSLAFARPASLEPHAVRAGLAAPTWRTWLAATGLSLAVIGFIVGVQRVLVATAVPGWSLVDPLLVVITGAVLLDIVDDLRRRRGAQLRVWTLTSAQHVEIAERLLTDADLPYHLAGANLRVALAGAGPFVPVDVLVHPQHAKVAHDALAAAFPLGA